MRFDPKSEKEIAESGLFTPGEYDFEITEAEEKQSKAGNDMVQLSVKIYDAEGNHRLVDDFLVGTEKAAYKIRHFAESVGLLDQYERGDIPAEAMIGRAGRCKIIIAKDKSGQYPDKNSVADYLKPKESVVPAARQRKPAMATTAAELDDEIPFVSSATDEALLLRRRDFL